METPNCVLIHTNPPTHKIVDIVEEDDDGEDNEENDEENDEEKEEDDEEREEDEEGCRREVEWELMTREEYAAHIVSTR